MPIGAYSILAKIRESHHEEAMQHGWAVSLSRMRLSRYEITCCSLKPTALVVPFNQSRTVICPDNEQARAKPGWESLGAIKPITENCLSKVKRTIGPVCRAWKEV